MAWWARGRGAAVFPIFRHFVIDSMKLWQYSVPVPKPVIGRKLDALMDKRENRGAAPSICSPDPRPSGAGVRSLMNGQPAITPPPRARVPRWYLFGADLLLVAVALVVLCKHPAPLTGIEKLFGVGAVVIGAALAVIATCMRDPKDS